jgi:hypothetical protein
MKWLLVLLAWGALAQDKTTGDKDRNGLSVAGAGKPHAGDKIASRKPVAAMSESLGKQRLVKAVQREGARKQAELLPLERLVHHDMEPAEPECDPVGGAVGTRH